MKGSKKYMFTGVFLFILGIFLSIYLWKSKATIYEFDLYIITPIFILLGILLYIVGRKEKN